MGYATPGHDLQGTSQAGPRSCHAVLGEIRRPQKRRATVSDNIVIVEDLKPLASRKVSLSIRSTTLSSKTFLVTLARRRCIGIVTASSTPSMDIKKWDFDTTHGQRRHHTIEISVRRRIKELETGALVIPEGCKALYKHPHGSYFRQQVFFQPLFCPKTDSFLPPRYSPEKLETLQPRDKPTVQLVAVL
ncbi:hypothetical protein FMUND_8903 [Fusarium mundagurra]|uniref:Uncharacterized protein n=1 Tax=Fusarium mundagurra TaxID=1567541 RepID=A0A8H6DBL8_9HYPO|nr:hypothetical protein FMUND_8903 [Fusarium mundagurra]